MRRNRAFGLVSVLAPLLAGVLVNARPAGAEETKAEESKAEETLLNPIEIGVFGGIHFYNKDHGLSRMEGDSTGTSPDTGGAFGLRLSYNIIKWVGVEGEFMVSPTRTRNDSTRDTILGYRLHVIGMLPISPYVQPFALFGFGALSAFPGTFNADDGFTYPRGRDTDGMFHVGVGAKFPINDNFGLRLDGRALAPGAIAHKIAKVGNETGYGGPDFEVLLSAYLGLGGERPAPPPPPPPPPPPVVDKDTDGDGILDKNDKCPNEAEDKDGFEDEDGCPDLDNDKDGIPDDKDKCPNEPETVNGFQDDDGCPDEVPAEVKKFTGVIKGINFKTNSDKITKDSFKVLDAAVKVLTDYPDIRLEIGGHTDNVGKAEYNLELSQKRAESVKNYFVGKGISADRLTAVGYGMDKPLTSNKTKADKAKNRRTEFTLLTGK